MKNRLRLIALFSTLLPLSSYAEQTLIEHIAEGTNVEVRRGDSTVKLQRGDEVKAGDTIITEIQTVYLKLPRFNELQIAPHTTLLIEDMTIKTNDDDETEGRALVVLQKGILWGLIANGVTLANPFYIRTPELALAVPGSNFVVEHNIEKKATTVVALEGNIRIARDMNEIASTTGSTFLNPKFRLYSEDGKISSPKSFKRNLLLSYLGKKARTTAKDMTNRGARALSAIAKKELDANTPNQITWIIPPGVGTSPSSGGGSPPIMSGAHTTNTIHSR